MKNMFVSLILLPSVLINVQAQQTITFNSLLDEMTNLERLTYLPDFEYRVVQFSSYDRRSRIPGHAGWFANSDGFGGEPIPGFEEVISEPDSGGKGTYLVCDVKGPGVIQRLWSAGINGDIRCYLDNPEVPVYEGNAEAFFHNTAGALSGSGAADSLQKIFRQFDATYLPVPFAKQCRIEWTGDINKIHFYQIGFRQYEEGTPVRTFSPVDIAGSREKIGELKNMFKGNGISRQDRDIFTALIQPGEKTDLVQLTGPGVVGQLAVRIYAGNMESVLRQSILNIWFDDSKVPQVQAPLGDFFGAAPGLNPYQSLPFSVLDDSLLVCRFPMPFRDSARICVENLSAMPVRLEGWIHRDDYKWEDGRSMHFRTRWKIDSDLTASNVEVRDIPYQLIMGKGRIVGTAAYLYNPSGAVTSWGNWWGEGDEKVFFDGEKFPSFFGTGSEDYFNYSWSSEKIFFFPYCGQPRNDGPGNRGHVANYRWHISDDLYFGESIAFYMELLHHGVVPDFSYGRIVYAYVLPGSLDDFVPVTARQVEEIPYDLWVPEAYLGSAGFRFFQAENLLSENPGTDIQEHNRWSEGKILFWEPEKTGDRLEFNLDVPEEGEYILGVTLAHLPGGSKIEVMANETMLVFNGSESINLEDPDHDQLRNYFSKPVHLEKGDNTLIISPVGRKGGGRVGLDFFWLKKSE